MADTVIVTKDTVIQPETILKRIEVMSIECLL